VFALDAGPLHRDQVLRRFPDRPVWIVARPPGDVRLAVVRGPLPAGVDPREALLTLANSPEPARP
jgi:hypothetical protein